MLPNAEERPYKRARLCTALETIVTLVVGQGDSQKSFVVHKDILTAASPFFDSTCKRELMVTEDQTIKLPEDEPDVVRAMIFWMYEDEIFVPKELVDSDGTSDSGALNNTFWGVFVRLYVLGEKYNMPRLCNDAIDAMISLLGSFPEIDFGVVSFVYQNTTLDDSPLRHFWVATAMVNGEWTSMKDRLCKEFLGDLAYAFYLMGSRKGGSGPNIDSCRRFHTHNEGNKQCRHQKKYQTYCKYGPR